MIHIFSSFFRIFRPIAVFFIAFGIFGLGSLLIIRYGTLVASLSNKDILAADQLGNVLAENDNIEDLLITFNYDTIFVRPVVFEQDITAPNVLYSLAAGSGLRVTGESQNPTITNTGVLSINGARGAVRFEAGDNITLTEEDGMIKITSSYIDTDTDTKLTEEEVERFVFDGENTGEFNGVKIGSISLDDPGVSSTTSGSSLIGVFGGNLSIIAGTNIQQIIESIDTNLSSVTDTSHAAVTLSGALDYLTLTGQQITLNQIDLTTDVSGILPIANGGTGAATISEARINLGIGTNNTVQFAGLSIGGTSPVITSILDEDDFASNSNTALPTQQSVKAYVDNEISGAALTYENGLTQTGSTVLLGGSLLQNTRLYSGSYEMLYLNTLDGNIGIGTTNPPAKLSVAAGSGAAEAFKVYRAATSLELFKVLENGTVTIGGTAADLNVGRNINATGGYVGSANYNTTYSGGYTHINASNNISVNIDSTNSSTTNYFAVYKDALSGNGSQLFRVQENGNVGIGTTNAGATLDVQGAAQFGTGDIDLINATGKIVAINSTYFASVDGSALTNLNASNLSSGTVPSARVSGNYSGITGLGTITSGTWQGSVINSTYLDSGVLLSTEIDTYSELNTLVADVTLTHNGLFDSYAELNTIVSDVTLTHNGLIDTSAELAAIVTNETGSGALVFGTSPSLTTPNIGAATGTSLNVTGAITAGGVITGTGSGLTGLNASNLSSGTVANGRISGSYTGITGVGTITQGIWQSTDIGAAYLDPTVIVASEIDTYTELNAIVSGVTLTHNGLIDTSAELRGIVTDETGSGALVFGTSPSLTTPNIGAANGTSLSLTGNLTASRVLGGTGNASAPGISFSADTNTGIFNNSTLGVDYLGFATGGTQRMNINSSGVVNISSDTFALGGVQRLSVSGPSGANAGNNSLAKFVMDNTLSDDGPFTQSTLYSEITNSGADYSSDVRAIYGKATNSQTTTSRIQESYGLYGEAIGNLNGSSSYAYGVYCSASGADFNYCGGNQTWTNTSDRRVKTNISTIEGALDLVNSLRGVRFQRTDDGSSKVHIGFIAQEVLPYVPEAVNYSGSKGLYSMGYAELTAVIVNAIKEQNDMVLTNKANIQAADIRLNDTGEVLKVVYTATQKLFAEQQNILDQINLATDIQDTTDASQSASLQAVTDQVKMIEKMTNDTQAVVRGLQDRISQLESLFSMQTATVAAQISEESSQQILGESTSQIAADQLIVVGDTNLNNLGITGDITAGLLSIKGFDDELGTPSASISTISGPLKLQAQATGNLEIMGGKIQINTDGDIFVQGSITVEKINIDESNEEKRSIGVGKIPSGEDTVTIHTTSVTEKSKIFLTVQEILTPITIVEKTPSTSFTVKIGTTYDKEILFDWLILN